MYSGLVGIQAFLVFISLSYIRPSYSLTEINGDIILIRNSCHYIHSSPYPLRLQQQLAGTLSALQIDMRLSNLLQRIDLVNLDFELARLEKGEQLVDVVLELFPGLDVSKQGRPGDLDALGREFAISVSHRAISNPTRSTYLRGSGGTGPLAFPNQTIVPFLLTASKLPSQVSLPTES